MCLTSRAFAKRPQVWENIVWYPTALIRNPYDDMLWRLADQDLDRWHGSRLACLSFHDRLDGIAQELPNNILQMTQDVRERRIKMTFERNIW